MININDAITARLNEYIDDEYETDREILLMSSLLELLLDDKDIPDEANKWLMSFFVEGDKGHRFQKKIS